MNEFTIDKPSSTFEEATDSNSCAKLIKETYPDFFKREEWWMFPHDIREMTNSLLILGLKIGLSEEVLLNRIQRYYDSYSHINFYNPPYYGHLICKEVLEHNFSEEQK
jgi:hypothetical protein